VPGAQLPGGLDAVHHRHLQVHQDDVRPALCGQGEGFFAVPGHPHDLDLIVRAQDGLQAIADDGLVITDQDTNHRRLSPPAR